MPAKISRKVLKKFSPSVICAACWSAAALPVWIFSAVPWPAVAALTRPARTVWLTPGTALTSIDVYASAPPSSTRCAVARSKVTIEAPARLPDVP